MELLPRPPGRHSLLYCLGLFIVVYTDGPQLVRGQTVEDAPALPFVYFIYGIVYIIEDFGYVSFGYILLPRSVLG